MEVPALHDSGLQVSLRHHLPDAHRQGIRLGEKHVIHGGAAVAGMGLVDGRGPASRLKPLRHLGAEQHCSILTDGEGVVPDLEAGGRRRRGDQAGRLDVHGEMAGLRQARKRLRRWLLLLLLLQHLNEHVTILRAIQPADAGIPHRGQVAGNPAPESRGGHVLDGDAGWLEVL